MCCSRILLGNSFNFAPRWGMVSPAEISRVDVMYGPFSALYPGNSIGAVLTMTTRMPDDFEVHAMGTVAVQPFSLYGRKELNLGGVTNILVGDRINDFRYWVGYEHLDNQGQAQTFPTFRHDAGHGGLAFLGASRTSTNRVVRASLRQRDGADYVQTDLAKVKALL